MTSKSEARERVLEAAERLFVDRGYEAVTVKDIAKAAGIHHASIYHHVPGGKSELYLEVMTRYMQNYSKGIEIAIANAEDNNLRDRLRHIAGWILSQPPLDFIRLTNEDVPALGDERGEIVSNLAFEATLVPILQVLEDARRSNEIEAVNLGNIAGAIFCSLQGLHSIPDRYVDRSRQFMADELIAVFIRGMKA